MILGWGLEFFNFFFFFFIFFFFLIFYFISTTTPIYHRVENLVSNIVGWVIFSPKFYILDFFHWEIGLVQYSEIFHSLQFILFKNIVKFFTTRNRKISVEHWFSPRTGGTRGVLRLYIPAHSSEPPNYAFFKSNDEICPRQNEIKWNTDLIRSVQHFHHDILKNFNNPRRLS